MSVVQSATIPLAIYPMSYSQITVAGGINLMTTMMIIFVSPFLTDQPVVKPNLERYYTTRY